MSTEETKDPKGTENKRGRKSKYLKEYVEQAYKVCRDAGYTDRQLALFFEVSESTLNNWKNQYPDFLASIKRGKDDYDTTKVENALLQRALGFEYTETKQIVEAGSTKSKAKGDEKQTAPKEKQRIEKTVKFIGGDVTAQIFWLCNRHKERWQHVQRLIHEGNPAKPLVVKQMSDAELVAIVNGSSGTES